jgi:hypothetical protein
LLLADPAAGLFSPTRGGSASFTIGLLLIDICGRRTSMVFDPFMVETDTT